MKYLIPILLTLTLKAFGQEGLNKTQKAEIDKLSAFFLNDKEIFKRTIDSSKIYSFYFEAHVKKAGTKRFSVVSLRANDSIAYQLYPNYNILKTISFNSFTKRRSDTRFIIPVVLEVVSSRGEAYTPSPAFLNHFLSIFPASQDSLEKYIYFRPIVFRINKQVFY